MGEFDRFSEFVRLRSTSLQRTAWLLTGDWAAAENLVQVALSKVWPRWDRIRRQDDPEVYVRRVMLTTFLGWRRRRWVNETALGWMPDHASSDDPFSEADTREVLLTAVRRLPARQRAVVVLRYFDDLSEMATAEVLGCSPGTVKSHASRALATLRAVLGLRSMVGEETS